MSKPSWTKVAVLLCGAVVLVWALAGLPAKGPGADKKDKVTAKERGKDAGKKELPAREMPGKDVFGLTKVHDLHLEISAKEWEKMQAVTGGMRFPGGPGGFGGPQRPEKPAEKPADVHKGNGFGMEFPWAHGQLTEDGKTYKDLGLRYKGNASYLMSARGLKRNFKIELDHYHADQRYHGLKTINLNAGAMDPTRAREALSFAVFRAAGVPAPRTSYAQVTLTVPGKYDKELLGLYTLIEQVDRTFLKDHFKNGKGLLMKPEGLRGIEYLGDDWRPYQARYKPKHEPSKKEAQRLIAFARLVNQADEVQFQKEVASYLDVDAFLRFVAVNALLSNLDSMFTIGHNYYLYLNPETNKFVFIPWDMDLSLAGFPMMGSPEQQLDLSLTHPYAGANKLIDRLMAIKDMSARYQKLLGELAATCFTKEQLLKDVEAIGKATKEVLAKETKAAQARKEGAGGFGFGPPGGPFGRSPDLKTFVEKRTTSVVAQLTGKSKGYVPVMGFGPGGPGGGGFGLGNFVAKPVLEALDTDKDGKLSKDELVAAVKKFFKDCDKAKKGKLDQQALAEGLNRLFPPPPPGFGPPGGGPGGPGGRPGGPGGPGGGRAVAVVSDRGCSSPEQSSTAPTRTRMGK
ncbi:MAG: CotH kinase family protein [Planctomycetes bacterium]|nr:CotH kinase family protein [Planctomycetota bacterium]